MKEKNKNLHEDADRLRGERDQEREARIRNAKKVAEAAEKTNKERKAEYDAKLEQVKKNFEADRKQFEEGMRATREALKKATSNNSNEANQNQLDIQLAQWENYVESVKKAYHEGYSYAIIFMDASMPLLDGYEATDEIRKFIRKMNILQPMVVATTGHTE